MGPRCAARTGGSGVSGTTTFLERSRFIPLRLSADERRLLHLLEAALSVSSYTDKASGFPSATPSATCFCLGEHGRRVLVHAEWSVRRELARGC